jgi:predicted Zn-dependent protease
MSHYKVLSLAAALIVFGGCATNPVTGKRELSLISEKQEVQIGKEQAQEAAEQMGLVNDPGLQQYVSSIGMELAKHSERPELPWQFHVIDDPTPNAFALPGGPVFVTRGLMTLMNSEAQLATVVGHEIGHVTARHSVNQLSKQQLAQLGLGIGAVLVPGGDQVAGLASQGLELLFLKYGRDDERQADELGFRYALNDGYDVREMGKVFLALERSSELEGAQKIPDWQSTHPAEPERIANVDKRVAALGAGYKPGRVDGPEYLQHVNGLAYGENPRNGFFRDGTFYHPEMKFQFTVPANWKTQNAPTAVQAINPQQNGAVQLTVAGKGSPEQAARQFQQQEGIEAGEATRENLNGVPSVVAPFQAQTQQGTLTGLAGFIGYGGTTYELVAYAPTQAFEQNEAAFRKIIRSFRPLDDPKILNVQPPKIEVVKLDRPMSLTQFAQQRSGGLSVERLAVLNQVADKNAPIPAGTQLKRVVGEVH